jgi:hypothetical protein
VATRLLAIAAVVCGLASSAAWAAPEDDLAAAEERVAALSALAQELRERNKALADSKTPVILVGDRPVPVRADALGELLRTIPLVVEAPALSSLRKLQADDMAILAALNIDPSRPADRALTPAAVQQRIGARAAQDAPRVQQIRSTREAQLREVDASLQQAISERDKLKPPFRWGLVLFVVAIVAAGAAFLGYRLLGKRRPASA